MSRSSNQKRKRKARVATGVPCESGRRERRRAALKAVGDSYMAFRNFITESSSSIHWETFSGHEVVPRPEVH